MCALAISSLNMVTKGVRKTRCFLTHPIMFLSPFCAQVERKQSGSGISTQCTKSLPQLFCSLLCGRQTSQRGCQMKALQRSREKATEAGEGFQTQPTQKRSPSVGSLSACVSFFFFDFLRRGSSISAEKNIRVCKKSRPHRPLSL